MVITPVSRAAAEDNGRRSGFSDAINIQVERARDHAALVGSTFQPAAREFQSCPVLVGLRRVLEDLLVLGIDVQDRHASPTRIPVR